MQVRYLDLSDYETLVKWWKKNRFPPPNIDDLPMVNGELQGVMVYKDDIEICAGFLIDTTVRNGAMFEYLIANFEVKNRGLREKAIQLLLDNISLIAMKMGKKYLFTSVNHPSLIKKLSKNGFETKSTGTSEMLKLL